MKTVKDYYRNRFNSVEKTRKNKIWKHLCEHVFNNYISKDDAVLDLGAGYCEFINNINCKTKIALDINPETKKFAQKGVRVIISRLSLVTKIFSNKLDIVFISNFLEHLNSKEEVISVIEDSFKVLKPGGKIIIMQPNIKLVGGRYWDFIDHKQALTVSSLVEALEIANFDIVKTVEKFLPYTTKSKLRIHMWMINLYLLLPEFLRVLAGQSLLVGQKRVK